jgi:isopropylmalate/homocitrate/citramalate synthase
MSNQVEVLDTTLRGGEQFPGFIKELNNPIPEIERLERLGYKVSIKDVKTLMNFDTTNENKGKYIFVSFEARIGTVIVCTATVTVLDRLENKEKANAAIGKDIKTAAFEAINRIAGVEFQLKTENAYKIKSGKDGQWIVVLEISKPDKEIRYRGLGINVGRIEAIIEAYIDAINNALTL